MRQYYYAEDNQQIGPISFEELKTKNISPDTLVWFEGLGDWTRAGDINELAELFPTAQETSTPPPPPPPPRPDVGATTNAPQYRSQQQRYRPSSAERPKNWLVESILVTIFCCLPLGIVAIINASKVDSKVSAGDLEGAGEASREAGKWVKITFWVGLAINVLVLFYYVAMFSVAMSSF